MGLSPYVNVILPVPLSGTFTYRLPESMSEEVTVGSRVIVPLGKRKFYTGIVEGFVPSAPVEFTLKDVTHVLDSHPVVRHPQLKFWEWMAEYYLCTIGEVYKAAVPSGLKIESETQFENNPDFDTTEISTLTEREAIVYGLLGTKGKLSTKEIEHQTGFRNVAAIMQKMFVKGVVVVSESLVNRFRPKHEQYVRITLDRDNPESLHTAFLKVHNAPKQEKLLMTLLQMTQFTDKSRPVIEVKVNELLEKASATSTILKSLVDKDICQRYTKETSRFRYDGAPTVGLPTLTEHQSQALKSIHDSYRNHQVTLLHGVTSSGKTEVYMHLIDYMLSQGQQVLYLVPEIALTTQLTVRLQAVFGDRLIIYHSRFTDNERVEIWNKLLQTSKPYVVIGARSSIFLPFAKLGLVIVDEEHEQSYKQFDPAPRYNGRDAAIMLAHMHGAKTLLGSATPSVETYYKATTGKYGLVSLTERYQGLALPEITITNMALERKRKQIKGSFALSTISAVRSAVEDGKQAILFHNRRGFAPMAHCIQCQYIPKCQHCDVSLTYHKRANLLVCHYCGATYPLPETCPVCKEPSIEVVGYGTERIEDEVEETFTEARTVRMDLDTTRNKNSYENLINTFSSHKADILVGTQMVTKGLDFGDVQVVAVINADTIINFPDFRSTEHAFNMLEQVAGRAGRRDTGGKVIIQTRTPEHPVIEYVRTHNYLGYYENEIEERRLYLYPPFVRLINIYLKHKDEHELDNITTIYADRLRGLFGNRVNGPTKPFVAKVQSLYIRQILLKVELNASMKRVKEILRELYINMHSSIPTMRQLVLYYDVDPY